MGKFQDLTGQKFGRLEAQKYLGKSKWLCLCDCGNFCNVCAYSLKSGNTKSCGCYNKEIAISTNTTHSFSKTKLYGVWLGMRRRCHNQNDKKYNLYGGRGITVCPAWRNDFKIFYDWAINNGYAETLTIDRIDVNGNYEPNNCRWVNWKEQARNKRNNHIVEINNQKLTLVEFAEKYHLNYSTVLTNIHRNKNILDMIGEIK